MEDSNINDQLTFRTDFFLNDTFEGKKAKHFFDINPINSEWNYNILACFLNQFTNFQKYNDKPFITNVRNQDYNTRFKFYLPNHPDISIYVKIGQKINVTVTFPFLLMFGERKTACFPSFLRVDQKLRSQPKYQEHIYFIFCFPFINSGTNALFFHKSTLFYAPHDFSSIFYYFAKKSLKFGLLYIFDTYPIHDFISYFINYKKDGVSSFETLKQKINGFIFFDIQKSTIRKRLPKINYKDENYYIKGGIYITPFAPSFLKNNLDKINGLLLDTTWKVLPHFVCSILMISTMNIGIPISFSFGPSENKKLYNRHFDTFSKTFGIDLATFPFESDQGGAIISIFEEKNINYFICLRHLLKSLTYNEFSYDISNILKCCSKEDLQNSFLTYSELFGCVIEPEKKILRDKILKKVGLIFEDNSIIIKDEKLWKKVSLFERMPFKMPSTTNSLESMHGQLNHNVPRHNNFWNAIYKLANHFMMKTHILKNEVI